MTQVVIEYITKEKVEDAAAKYLNRLVAALPGYGIEKDLHQDWIINGNNSDRGTMVATEFKGSRFPPFAIGVRYNKKRQGRVVATSTILTEDQIRETLQIE